eukprot:TRINITY_DN6820_c0_g1_i1.p1 TRINITY_DN6820_c0_g1~~TRINITY_DN6820_c0_g1_i1.p1  ORF type:complete len:845 (+),score=354.75 TRINITY_DN6820_c0_g1_i1:35-2569(+)
MGKKSKVGKQRRDKAYWSAKEIGFRSRASFKLVQLNRKYEFLQKSRVCLDLCAAPGSWMQVAKEHMPLSSIIVGVDLVPIKPIPGCISFVNDITTDKCRSDIKKELQGWKVDVVLHDGAPNVGKSWIHDAYQQSLLTLSAFKLATEFLKPQGTFVTKIFRSKDYQSLLWVLQQFFRKVHSTKPPASRNESAEIFVVCLGYKAPDTIDPRFLDPSSVFSEVETPTDETMLANPEKVTKKAPAVGYESTNTLLFRKTPASEFIFGDKPIHILNNSHVISPDTDAIRNHPKTTKEVLNCLADIKVLGMKELRLIKKWRESLKVDLEKKEEGESQDADKMEVEGGEEGSDEELSKLEKEIDKLNEDERKALRRKRKKVLKEKRKRAEKIDLKMIIPGDMGPRKEEEGLFNIKNLKTIEHLRAVEDVPADMEVSDSEDEEEEEGLPSRVKYTRDQGSIHSDGLFYKNPGEKESDDDEADGDFDSEDEDLDLKEVASGRPVMGDEEADRLNEPSSNPLLLDLDASDRDARRFKKSEIWFDKDAFKGLDEENEDLEELDIQNAIKDIENRKGSMKTGGKKEVVRKSKGENKKPHNSEDDSSEDDEETEGDSSSSESDYEEVKSNMKNGFHGETSEKDGYEVVPLKKKAKKREALTPEELALGQQLIQTKKAKRDLMDAGWNRFMFPDDDKDLPSWFVHEEQYHMRLPPAIDPQTVAYYTDRGKDLNVKTIKKVVEAKARKKRRMNRKMDKAKKRAAAVMENEDIGSREKMREVKRIYTKVSANEKAKKEVTYTVAKKFSASKRAKRPSGLKGLYKQVDPRMKKDNTSKRTNASEKRNQKRKLKGKKTRPNA